MTQPDANADGGGDKLLAAEQMAAADQIFAWVTDEPGQGVILVGAMLPGSGISPMPLVFVQEHRATNPIWRAVVEDLARSHGQTVRLVRFRSEAVLEVIEP